MNHIEEFKLFIESMRLPGKSGNKVDSWINVKIDRDLNLRVSRYAYSIDEYAPSIKGNYAFIDQLREKLHILSNPTPTEYRAQCKLAVIILLQYLKEIKSNFDPSASGFLFEDYISGLLHGKKIGNNKYSDFMDDDGNTYQIKFYKGGSYQVNVNPTPCDYYIVGLKTTNEVRIYAISVDEVKSNGDPYVYEHADGKTKIDVTGLKKELEPIVLDLSNIDSSIEILSRDLRRFITELYEEISELNYNIETVITGVNKENKVIPNEKVDDYYNYAEENIRKIGSTLTNVKKSIMLSIDRK